LFRAIAFGRLGGTDDRIKQGSLAAAGYGRFVRKANELRLSYEYRFNVFGLSNEQFAREEEALKRIVNGEARRQVNVMASPYTEDRQELFTELARNEVALMLSWHEGFGLVGWEAIAAEVPLIVSRATGLYALLRDDPQTFGADCVYDVDVRGSDDDSPNEHDVEEVATVLLRIATDLKGALTRAAKLRQHLSGIHTWEQCARGALEACGWGILAAPSGAFEPAAARGGYSSGGTTTGRTQTVRKDIERLRAHTAAAHQLQAELSTITVSGVTVKIARPCTDALLTAAQASSLLVLGDPGAGKSGALYELVRNLLNHGNDVVLFAVDQLAADSPGQLRTELGLQHDLVEVLRAWGGAGAGYLVIDALDAARSEGSARALRQLIAQVLSSGGRWRVIASVRKFDLRYGQELQRLFAGSPDASFNDAAFGNVRHLNVPDLSDDEVSQATAQSPALARLVAASSPGLKDLLRNPFNLRLAAALLDGGTSVEELTPVRTQLELLDRYWEARVRRGDRLGDAREAVLRIAAEEMVRRRAMRAPRSVVARDPSVSERLHEVLSEKVLVEWQAPGSPRPDQSLLAFSHHMLFDYGVARLIFRGEPEDAVRRLEEEPDLALAVRPSIVLHLHHLWTQDARRGLFWDFVTRLQRSEAVPDIAKIIGPAVAGDLFTTLTDMAPLIAQLGGPDAP
jgi:hypothetical protein